MIIKTSKYQIQKWIEQDRCPDCGGKICKASTEKPIDLRLSNPSRSLILSRFEDNYRMETNQNNRVKCCEDCTWCERG